MKQISARTFRLSFATLEEPVTVILRGGDGYRILGTWTPLGAKIAYEDTWALNAERFGKPKAVPKP